MATKLFKGKVVEVLEVSVSGGLTKVNDGFGHEYWVHSEDLKNVPVPHVKEPTIEWRDAVTGEIYTMPARFSKVRDHLGHGVVANSMKDRAAALLDRYNMHHSRGIAAA